jgi:hypothetical protein
MQHGDKDMKYGHVAWRHGMQYGDMKWSMDINPGHVTLACRMNMFSFSFDAHFFVPVHVHVHATCPYSMDMQREDIDMKHGNEAWTGRCNIENGEQGCESWIRSTGMQSGHENGYAAWTTIMDMQHFIVLFLYMLMFTGYVHVTYSFSMDGYAP